MSQTRMVSYILLAVLLLLLLSLPLPGWAQDGKPGSAALDAQAYQISWVQVTNNSVIDQAPSIAYNSVRREYLVVWQRSLGGGSWGIFARRLSNTGNLLGGEITIDTSGVNWEAAVAYNSSNDQYLITYTYNSIGSPDYDVLAQLVSSSGTLLNGYIQVDITGPTKQSYPEVAYNSINNEYLVVYQSEKSVGGALEIRGRRVSAAGSLLGGSMSIASLGKSRRRPDVAYNPSRNQYLVVYTYDYSTSDHDIYGRRVTNDLGWLGDELIVWDTARDQHGAKVANAGDEYLVVWHDGNQTTVNDFDIVGRRVQGNGSISSVAFNIAADGARNRFWPDVAFAPGRLYMVVWHVDDGGTTSWNTRGRRVIPGQDVAMGSEFPIDDTAYGQYNPAVACGNNGACFVAEEDHYYTSMAEITVARVEPRREFVPLLRRW